MELLNVVWILSLFGVSVALCRSLYKLWWIPRVLEKALFKQGLRSPPRNFLLGNLILLGKIRVSYSPENQQLNVRDHDIVHHVFPDYPWLIKNYGKSHMVWWATEPRVHIDKPELVREILSKSFDSYWKSPSQLLDFIFGTIAENGETWVFHRKLAAPAFHAEKLKGMTNTFVDCTLRMFEKWDRLFSENPKQQEGVEIEVLEELTLLTADAIANVGFGSSFEKAKRAFEILNSITDQHLKVILFTFIPLARWIPTKTRREIWRDEKEVDRLMSDIVDERRNKVRSGAWSSYGDDLLGLIVSELESGSSKLTKKKAIQECKTMHIVGSDTTSTLLTWTLFLLAIHPEWQVRLREEVLQVCGREKPDAETLTRLKQVVMVLNETLRLYSPVGLMFRSCFEDVQLGELHLPKGTAVHIPILAIHHDKELWGEDANEFNPLRFENGAAKASKHPNAFLPFSLGPRICLGMNLALTEAKVALAMILQRFEFSISPRYRHCPIHHLTLKPQHGMQLVFKRV